MVASWVLGIFYPTYQSFHAIESASIVDDKQWLTYWTVYAFMAFFEAFAGFIVNWIPLYYELKSLAVIWMIAPQTMGAAIVYDEFIKPFFMEHKGLEKINAMVDQFLHSPTGKKIAALVGKEVKEAKEQGAGAALAGVYKQAGAAVGGGDLLSGFGAADVKKVAAADVKKAK